jgi:MFS family permease
VWAYATLFALFGLGVGLQSPAYNSLVSKAVPENMRGMAFGLFWTSLGIISLPAPYIGAALWERFEPSLPFTITAILAILSAVPVYYKFKLPDKDEDPPPLASPASSPYEKGEKKNEIK